MPRGIRRGVSSRLEKKLRQKMLAASRDAARERRRKAKAFAGAVQAFAKPYQKAMASHLDGKAAYARYQRDATRIRNEAARVLKAAGTDAKKHRLATDAIAAEVRAAQRRHAPMMQQAFDRVVDGAKYWGELMLLIQRHGGGALKSGPVGSATFQALASEEEPDVTGQPLSFVLEPPYDDDATFELAGGPLIGDSRADAFPDEGRTETSANIGVGGARDAEAGVGDSVTVPAGATSVSLTARVRVDGTVFALGVLAVAQASVGVVCEIDGVGNGARRNEQVVGVMAPLGYFAISQVNDLLTVSTSALPVPAGGAAAMVRGGGYASASGAGVLCVGKAYVAASVQQLTVNLEY